MTPPIRILLLEDNASDAELIHELLQGDHLSCEVSRVETRAEFLEALETAGYDLILADYRLPAFDGLSALKIALNVCPDLPFIFVSGALGEEVAIQALKTGATDYVLKTRLSRLVPAVQRALREARERSERKRAEDELRASEARFRTFVDHATDAFFLLDDQATVLDVNRQACASLGHSREELIGMHPRDFDVALDESAIQRLRQRIAAGETSTFETRHRRKDGTVFPVEIRACHFEQGGSRFLALVRDITERKRAEQRLAAQHTVTRILAEAATIEEAMPEILRVLCEDLGWDLGALWRIDQQADMLRCAGVWRVTSVEAVQFEAATWASTFRPGSGLPGRVWASRTPEFIPDVIHDPAFLRADVAAREGLHAAFAFPILLGSAVLGVIDVLGRSIRQPDQDLLDMVATIGSQIGQFIERKRAETRRKLLVDELNHRVKNTLATVIGIAKQTLRTAETPTQFAESFEDRLYALSQTHNLLTQASWRGASLMDVLRLELAPHVDAKADRCVITGDNVELVPKAAVLLGMVLHELATNAVKFGALSQPTGKLRITSSVRSSDAELTLVWQESGGPLVAPRRRTGFGSRLLEQGIVFELDGAVTLDFEADGLGCRIMLPSSCMMTTYR